MPELPEVETIARSLRPRLEGRRILEVRFLAPRVLRGCPDTRPERLVGATVQQVRRLGKNLIVVLDAGFLVIHLGMTGRLLVDAAPGPHTRAVFTLSDGVLLYDDIRQFGRLQWSERVPKRIEALGPEPLEIDAMDFRERLRGRRTSIKALLLDQAFVRGMGNIYTDEALFRARVHPRTPACRLGPARAGRLHAAMQEVLREAIAHRGSSISDYVDAEGERGGFQDRHQVYGKDGKPCARCGTVIRKTVVAQRGTHFCPVCQRV